MAGVFLICVIGMSNVPIPVARMPVSFLSERTMISDNWLLVCKRMFITVSRLNRKRQCLVSYPKYEKKSPVSPSGKVKL